VQAACIRFVQHNTQGVGDCDDAGLNNIDEWPPTTVWDVTC